MTTLKTIGYVVDLLLSRNRLRLARNSTMFGLKRRSKRIGLGKKEGNYEFRRVKVL